MIYLRDLHLIMAEVSLGECLLTKRIDEDGNMEALYKGSATEESGKRYDILIKISTKEPAVVKKIMNKNGQRSYKDWYSLRRTWTNAYIRDENNLKAVADRRNQKKLMWYVCMFCSTFTVVYGTIRFIFAPSLYNAFLVFAGILLLREAKIRKNSMCYGHLENLAKEVKFFE